MNNTKWLKLFLICNLLLILSSLLISVYFHKHGIPLRFTNSISYDAKLNFLKESKILDSADTIVVGSSMALNNIDSSTLEKELRDIKKVANISSWGLQTSEVLELLKLLKLKKIKYLIYSTQFIDFRLNIYKNNDSKIKKFLYTNNFDDTIILPYFNTINTLISNYNEYLNWKDKYLNENKNSYLKFDENGDINLTFTKKKKEKNDWFKINPEEKLNEENYNNLISIKEIADKYDIKLIVVTTPFKKTALENDKKMYEVFNTHNNRLHKLSKKHSFTYLNVHDKLNLEEDYFLDKIHVNKKGAILISQEISKKLKN